MSLRGWRARPGACLKIAARRLAAGIRRQAAFRFLTYRSEYAPSLRHAVRHFPLLTAHRLFSDRLLAKWLS